MLSIGSLELRVGVDVAPEGTVVDIGAGVVHEGHGWLVHATIPLDIARSTVTVPVDVLVVLVVDWRLPGAPLAVRIRSRRVLGENARDGPVEEVRIVDEGLGIESVIIEDNGPVGTEAAADAPHNEPADPSVGKPATHIEVFDGQLADDGEAEEDTKLRTSRVVSPVEIRLVSWASDHREVIPGEPALENIHIMEGLLCPLELSLLEDVLRDTEAD